MHAIKIYHYQCAYHAKNWQISANTFQANFKIRNDIKEKIQQKHNTQGHWCLYVKYL